MLILSHICGKVSIVMVAHLKRSRMHLLLSLLICAIGTIGYHIK